MYVHCAASCKITVTTDKNFGNETKSVWQVNKNPFYPALPQLEVHRGADCPYVYINIIQIIDNQQLTQLYASHYHI